MSDEVVTRFSEGESTDSPVPPMVHIFYGIVYCYRNAALDDVASNPDDIVTFVRLEVGAGEIC